MIHTAHLFTATALLAQTAGGSASGSAAVQGTSQLLVWAIILFGMAIAFFFAEVFVPSGGLLGACAALCLIGGVVMLFGIDTTVGLIGLIISLLAIPFALMLALKIWPNTPIGKALTLGSNDDPDSAYDGQVVPPAMQNKHEPPVPVGTLGKSLTELHPVGTCLLNNLRLECLSESGVIEKGTRVRVVAADGLQIKVRPEDAG